jgi:hypothetical protein
MPARFPERREFPLASGAADGALFVGPSLHGGIYRSFARPCCYRLLAPEEATLEVRAELRAWKDQPRRPGLAPVVDVTPLYEEGSVVVQYEIGVERTAAEALAHADPAVRLRHAARIAAALPDWWSRLGQGLLPMPADIVFAAEGVPHLLPMPLRRLPPMEKILAENARAICLAPELLRGSAAPAWGDYDLYALGVLLLGCFYRTPETGAEELLLRAANQSLFESHRLRSTLPGWLEGRDAPRQAVAAIRRLVDAGPAARAEMDAAALAAKLAEDAAGMEPLALIARLREAGNIGEALDLTRRILAERGDYQFYFLAAELARLEAVAVVFRAAVRPATLDLGAAGAEIVMRSLGLLLEALDFLERAIGAQPGRMEPFEEQLRIIGILEQVGLPLGALPELSPVLRGLDAILWRNFHRLAPQRQQEHELTIARYLLNKGEYGPAAEFIHPRLSEGDKYQWWKFGLNLAYAEALIGLGRLDDAHGLLQFLKGRLKHVRDNRSVPEADVRAHGRTLAELEARLLEKKGEARAHAEAPKEKL